jgi:hypothetical protein
MKDLTGALLTRCARHYLLDDIHCKLIGARWVQAAAEFADSRA